VKSMPLGFASLSAAATHRPLHRRSPLSCWTRRCTRGGQVGGQRLWEDSDCGVQGAVQRTGCLCLPFTIKPPPPKPTHLPNLLIQKLHVLRNTPNVRKDAVAAYDGEHGVQVILLPGQQACLQLHVAVHVHRVRVRPARPALSVVIVLDVAPHVLLRALVVAQGLAEVSRPHGSFLSGRLGRGVGVGSQNRPRRRV
jgi:hypothetical protein